MACLYKFVKKTLEGESIFTYFSYNSGAQYPRHLAQNLTEREHKLAGGFLNDHEFLVTSSGTNHATLTATNKV